ncbi:MAG: hypothetical protein ACRDTD_03580 [Pseudonocardiaceae bacterium]
MDQPSWVSGDVDLEYPSAARVYDYYLRATLDGNQRASHEFIPLWRPDSPADVDDHPERFSGYAGVGRRG